MIDRIMARLGWAPMVAFNEAADTCDRLLKTLKETGELRDRLAEENKALVKQCEAYRASWITGLGQLEEARRPIIIAPHRDGGGRIMLVVSR